MDKKRIIKALSVLLCAVMLVGYVPAAAFAQTEETAEPAVEETAAPATEAVTEPATEAVTEPVTEPVEETVEEETAPQFLAEPGAQDPAAGEEGNLGSGTPDGTPPVLHSITLSATTVTIPGQLEVIAEASDDVSGVDYVSAHFVCEETGKDLYVRLDAGYWEWDEVNYKDNWITYPDGKLHGTLKVDQYVESGTFRFDYCRVYDVADNSAYYDYDYNENPLPEQVKNLSFDVIESDTPDGTPPVLHSITLSASTVTAPGQLEVIAEASDDVSGVDYMSAHFVCEETGKDLYVRLDAGYWEWDEVNYKDNWITYPDGKLHGTLKVGQYVESGTFRFDYCRVYDVADNSAYYDYDYNENPLPEQVKNLSFDVIESDTPDGTPPVLHSITLSASTVTAPGQLEVIAEASDDVSGVDYVSAHFVCEETGKDLYVRLDAGYWEWDEVNYKDNWITYPDGKLHGTLKVDQYVESGTFRFDYCRVYDVADNSAYYDYDYNENPLPEQVKNLQLRVRNVGADVVTSVSKGSFVNDVAKADDNAYIVADYSGDATLDEDLFEAIAGTNKTLDLTSDGITWRFNGQDITEDIKPVDLQVEILPVEEDSSPEGDGIQDSLENAPGVVMKFPENGVLPGKATIQVKVDYAMREYLGRSKGLCVYYYNNQTGEMELIAENLIVVNEGYVEFSITHCSDYILTRDPEIVQNRLDLTGMDGGDILWVDGTAYDVQQENGKSYVDLPDGNANVLVTYSWHVGDPADVHTQYPTGMQVWILKLNEYGTYNKVRVTELDDILQYSGSSIRITGKKGIRMITSVEKYKKDALTSYGLSGFKLLEYGTLLSWASDLEGGKPLILGQEYAKSNYAYKKDVADPVFAYSGDLVQYTNVLVGFTNDQCKDDIAMRSYMILEDEQGQQYTIYGGIVYRSIGYIAWQNRGAFAPGSAAYAYVWEIIHHVYGDQFDEEYKG